MDMLNTLLKVADNEYSAIVEDGIDSADIKHWIDTGSYSLNALLSGSIYGGFAGNKRLVLAGLPSTGKSFYTLALADSFLKEHPTGFVFYFESETAITKKMIQDRNMDMKRIVVMPIVTVQDFATQAMRILDKYWESGGRYETAPMMFCLDSLGNLSTIKEQEDIAKGNNTKDMTRAQLLKGAFRALTLKLGRSHVPLISTNHIYDVVGSYVPTKKMSGGSGAEYAGDQIIFLSKSKIKDGTNVTGVIIKASLYKSRLTVENKKVETKLDFKSGLDRYYGLTEIALNLGIFKKNSTKIQLPDGTTQFEKTINNNPEKFYTKDVLDRIDAACKDEFLYGKTNKMNDEEKENDNPKNQQLLT